MNRRVLVTGATGGVGTTICRYLSNAYQVLAVGRNNQLLDQLSEAHPNIQTYQYNLDKSNEVAHLLKEITSQHGYVPYIINNAGVNINETLVELALESLESSLRINAIAPFMIMQHMLPIMRSHGFGRIVNVTSGAPLNCFPGFSAYSASKAALNALTVTAAKEYGAYDIKINLMSPGPVRSGMSPSAIMEPEVCLPTLDYLLDIDSQGPSGRFFWLGYEIPLFSDLEGIDWLNGSASDKFSKVISGNKF